MSGGLEIDHGGAIAVDTGALRDVGHRTAALAAHFDEAGVAIDRAHRVIDSTPELRAHVDTHALRSTADRIRELQREAESAGTGTLLMADAFEVVELRAEAEALALTDSAASDVVQARIDRMLAADGRLEVMADWLVAGWKQERFEGLDDQWDLAGMLPPFFLGGAVVGVASGLGKIRPGTPLKGTADPVTVAPVKTSQPASPPSSLKGAFERMPAASGAQVAVEKYTMSNGTTRYVTYVRGTQKPLPGDAGGPDPWDMKSNAELFTGHTSASYQATLDALAAAGAEPGDQVDVVGHSHGGMIAARLAMESEFDVSMQMTAGSPSEPTLDDDQTLIQLAHTDDVVRSLAAGGSAAGTGSADSFTASRVGDPEDVIQDLALRTHDLETYIETAEMVDRADDPRAEALDVYWAELGTAVAVERTEYRAERVGR